MHMDPTSQNSIDRIYAHMKATSEHNSPTKVDSKQTVDNKAPNPTFTCESNISTQLMP